MWPVRCTRPYVRNVFRGVLLMVPLAAAAQQIGGVTVDPPQVMVGQPFEAVVSISSQAGSFFCGLVVSMGDGNTREIRVAEKDIPLKMGHQYKVPGTYSITVEGKLLIRGFRTAPACDGRVISVPILVAAGEPSVTTRAVVAQPVQDPMAELRQSAAAGDVDAMTWCSENSGQTTHVVGQKKPNALGLYDMHGNAWEWCADGQRVYAAEAQVDPNGGEGGRTLRGGSHSFGSDACRSAARRTLPTLLPVQQEMMLFTLGFRVLAR